MPNRVFIRPPVVDDCEPFLAAVHASRELHGEWVHPPVTSLEFNIYLRRVQRADNPGFFVCREGDGTLLGVINLNHIMRGGMDCAFLGYYAFAGHEGKGYMTEGLGLIMRHAFANLDLHRLEANIQPGNTRSIELVRRCGFRHEGFSPRYMRIGNAWCDHERYAITIEEWRPRK